MSSVRGKLGAAFILTLVGSALVLVSGVVVLALYLTLAGRALEGVGLPAVALRTVRSFGVLVALVTVVPGALGLVASVLIRLGHPTAGGILAIVSSPTS